MKNFKPYSNKFAPKDHQNNPGSHPQNPTPNAPHASGQHAAPQPQTAPEAPETQSKSGPHKDPTPTPTPQEDTSMRATEELGAKIAALTADLQRTRADFENFRKQAESRRAYAEKTAKLQTVSKFLPLLDNLDHALKAYPELAPLQKTFDKTLSELGLTPIEITEETEFNPDLHEAVTAEGDGDRELVAEVLRPGYYYAGEVLRPAMVKVRRV